MRTEQSVSLTSSWRRATAHSRAVDDPQLTCSKSEKLLLAIETLGSFITIAKLIPTPTSHPFSNLLEYQFHEKQGHDFVHGYFPGSKNDDWPIIVSQ